jgi:cell wall-associated NlpC family hydrolase
MMDFADRLLPARPDIAAKHLRGQVEAERFVKGDRLSVTASLLDLTLVPDPGAERQTQLLHGERFMVYETREDGLSWGQSERDGYVGYVASAGLSQIRPVGQTVTALWSHVYPEPKDRARPQAELPYLAQIATSGESGNYARLRDGGYVPRRHLAPIEGDFTAQAERFIGVPYLWGGRSARGIDCSSLVQLAIQATGLDAPRDSDMQLALLGEHLDPDADLQRGDLIFWHRHMGVMRDADTLLHANAHHMAVAFEPLAETIARIARNGGGDVTGRKRLRVWKKRKPARS